MGEKDKDNIDFFIVVHSSCLLTHKQQFVVGINDERRSH